MSNLYNTQRKLAEGISGWLIFEFHCMRGDLFSEKYLATPTGQILTSLFDGRVKAEQNHPSLIKKAKTVGRPAQIDFVALDENGNWDIAIETKWITRSPITLTQIIWDLIRLELLLHNKKCNKCYFVISGFNKKFDILRSTHFHPDSANPKLITERKNVTIKMNLKKLPATVKGGINKRLAKYESLKIPTALYFSIPHSYPSTSINMTFKTIVWEVKYNKKQQRIQML